MHAPATPLPLDEICLAFLPSSPVWPPVPFAPVILITSHPAAYTSLFHATASQGRTPGLCMEQPDVESALGRGWRRARHERPPGGSRLDAFDTLLTLAEVSLGLAGFAGIVIVFGRGPGALPPADSFRLLALVGCSLGTLFLSLIPIALGFVGVAEPELWQWSSALMLAAAVPAHLFALLARSARRGRAFRGRSRLHASDRRVRSSWPT